MKLKAFEAVCDRRCPVTADEFLGLATHYLGAPTEVWEHQGGNARELVWRRRRQLVAWVILRRDPASGQWYPEIGGR